MKKSIFESFEPLQVSSSHSVLGGAAGDTGTTSFIQTTHGTTGLDNYADPVYNDGNRGDWEDRDACK